MDLERAIKEVVSVVSNRVAASLECVVVKGASEWTKEGRDTTHFT